ncbi:ceramide glucosyltransferase [Rhodobacter sp. Har01]|uniref:ceramide glucosyltransferase n=1 Tax=Rhodobacter sp. Har01 TaxID=2883999 RepID=UPI001D099B84|nr:ceramide glucosyltransferase [Rhodobacter sp. Har01]MCB6179787.1 ceramide glucosyltransferase [Rhodobacter sp. Har01]
MTLIAASALAVLSGLHLTTAALAASRRGPRQPRAPQRPLAITLLRPVCGVDAFDLETLESSFRLNDPGCEIIFCAAHEDDPACAAVRAMIARHPDRKARFLVGEDRITANPKLNNLIKGWAAATGSHVAMADANLLLPPDYLDHLWDAWTPDCGLVTSPPAGIRPGNLWGALECAFLNGFQARWQLAADSAGLGFAQGKTLFVEKAWLDAAGGLAALGRDLAEDVAFTKIVRAGGRKVRLTRQIFAQPVGRRSLRAVWDRQLRWSRVRRDGFPALFAAEILLGALPPALLLLSLAPAVWLLPLLALWYGAELALSRAAGWPAGPRDLAAMGLRDLLLPALWLATWARRGFDWRGTAMEVVRDPA